MVEAGTSAQGPLFRVCRMQRRGRTVSIAAASSVVVLPSIRIPAEKGQTLVGGGIVGREESPQ